MRSAALVSLLLLAAPLAAADAAPRGVLLLIADDLGRDLGCYGHPVIKTPHLDALAQRGVRFTHAFATTASCSPSRSVLYTGQHTHSNGQYGLAHATHNFHTFRTTVTLPRLLRDAGARTGILAKNHVQPKEVYPWEVELGAGGGRNGVPIVRAARQFLQESAGKPFLLTVGFTDPHRAARGFANDNNYPQTPVVRYDPKEMRLPYFLPDRPEVRQEVAEYAQSVSRLDHNVGLVLKALEESGRAKDTLVIFLSDNGIPFPGAKTTLYDSGVRLPLLISSPARMSSGRVNEAMVSWVDITPTILDWMGVKAPTNLVGRSILPILDQERPKGWDTVFGSHQSHEITNYYPMRMIRTRTHKYLLNLAHPLPFPFASDLYESTTWQGVLKRGDKTMGQREVASFLHRPREELYDLTKDPNELTNVAADPAQATVLNELRQRLKEWQTTTKDPWLVKYRYE